jgi:hypothetical protein
LIIDLLPRYTEITKENAVLLNVVLLNFKVLY